jgi:phospholipid transport system transporter-binding protein
VAEPLALPEQLRHEEAPAWISRLEAAIAAQPRGPNGAPALIDCSALDRFDSSAVVVLLGALRCAQAAGVQITLKNLPDKLLKLASLYGVDGLLLNSVT